MMHSCENWNKFLLTFHNLQRHRADQPESVSCDNLIRKQIGDYKLGSKIENWQCFCCKEVCLWFSAFLLSFTFPTVSHATSAKDRWDDDYYYHLLLYNFTCYRFVAILKKTIKTTFNSTSFYFAEIDLPFPIFFE